MRRVRSLLTSRKCWLAVLVSLGVYVAAAYFLRGTLIVQAEVTRTVGIFSGRPRPERHRLLDLFRSDARPDDLILRTPDDLSDRHCVFFGQINGERSIRLNPGTYAVVVYQSTPCGDWGHVEQTIEVRPGGRVEHAIP